jgi:phytoene desaturase
MNHDRAPILIIGAGIGGLSAAIHLAAEGYHVIVLEKNQEVGGKMAIHTQDGYTWDTGPSVITMKPVLASLFERAGRRIEDYIDLQPVDPITRYLYPDGTTLDATPDLTKMARQIAAIEPKDVEGYLRFLAHAAALHRITSPVFIHGEPPTLGDFLRVPLRDIVKVDAWRSMDRAIRHWVHSPYLRHLLRRYATYVGASPYRAPAVLNVIAHNELTQGIWYPHGGVYTVARAYQRLATDMGVQIRTGCPVDGILTSGRRVTGVRTDAGEVLNGQAVVSNVDVTTTYHDLLPTPTGQKAVRRLTRFEHSLSAFVLLLGLSGTTPGLRQHNVLFPSNYRQEFTDIFGAQRPPQSPTVYVTISAKADPDHAPENGENWFVLVNVPALTPSFEWKTEAPRFRDRVLDRIEAMGYDVRHRIQTEAILTPEDIQARTGAWRGSLYGLSSNQPLNALRRPHPRSPYVRGLYFTGGTTHPGGGVPMVTLSGKVTATIVQRDLGTEAPR